MSSMAGIVEQSVSKDNFESKRTFGEGGFNSQIERMNLSVPRSRAAQVINAAFNNLNVWSKPTSRIVSWSRP